MGLEVTSQYYILKARLSDNMEYLIVPDRDPNDDSVTKMNLYKFNTVTEEFDLDSGRAFPGYNAFHQYCFTQDMEFSGYLTHNSISVITGIK